jgi:hypothetical protein
LFAVNFLFRSINERQNFFFFDIDEYTRLLDVQSNDIYIYIYKEDECIHFDT